MTLPGTHARLLAVTWGKPVSGTPAGAPVLCPSGRVSGSVPSVPVVESAQVASGPVAVPGRDEF